MSQNIDPRLGPQYAGVPATVFSGSRGDTLKTEAGVYPAQQPYYHYLPPQTHTPQHHGAPHSDQTSPEQNAFMPVDGEASPEQGLEGQNGDDAKRPRACEACRGLKVRCDQDPQHPEISCKRCAKAGRQCVITQPSRKRQKKADSRVAELEKKLDALTAALHQQQGYAPGPTADVGSVIQARTSSSEPDTQPSKRRRTDEEASSYDPVDAAINPGLKTEEQIGKGFKDIHTAWGLASDLKRYLHHTTPEEFVNRINALISPEVASTIFERYTTKLVPHLPAVVFPAGTTAEQVFKEKPILYVCILSASSFGTLHPNVSKKLAREAVGAVADCVVRNGAKSLELIQAMQVMALWYKPPEQAEQTNFYQIIHMAAVMALDIGLGKRFNPAKARRGFGGPNAQYVPGPHRALAQDSDTLEARRAWLTCYYLCASASMVLRRPNLVRWTNYMKECIEVLETHPDAYPSDKLFCQHVKIQHICEDIGLQFLMDDNTATISITDPKVTYALNVLENQLKTWKEQVPAECRGQGLQFFEHVTSLYLHEIALHFNHNIEDFRLPFTEESLKSASNTSDTLSQNQMAALEACLKAAHGILSTMLSYEMSTVKSLPMLLFFVRCVYAIVILIKMHVAVCTPNSELGKMMKPDDLRVDYYLDRLINLFAYVSKDGEDFKPHPKILHILSVLKEWFNHHKANVQQQTPLHLLSQVATQPKQPTPEVAEWFNPPMMIPAQPSVQDQYGVSSTVDPTNQDYGWGSGFEQAMDIALGGMDGLQGGGLDNWFLGDSMAPFGFNGDAAAGGW